MLNCWHNEPQARLSFTQLKYSFKSIVVANSPDTTGTTSINVQPANSYAFVLLNDSLGDSTQNLKESSDVRYTRLPTDM